MNRSGFKIFLIIALLLGVIFQAVYIQKDKREEKTFQKTINDIEYIESEKNVYPSLEDYINKLVGFEFFTISSIHILDDYYEVKGNVIGDSNTLKDFISYLNYIKDYKINEYLVDSLEEQYQLDVVLELPR